MLTNKCYLITNRKNKGLWDVLVSKLILVAELSLMKTLILQCIIMFLQQIDICLGRNEKIEQMHCDSRYNTLFFVTRVTCDSHYTYSVFNITVYIH